ncbi:hypothetical protein D3C72_2098540 [compost metagenome]
MDAPGTYQIELPSGELFEVTVALCLPLGEACHFLSALHVDDEHAFGAVLAEDEAPAFAG